MARYSGPAVVVEVDGCSGSQPVELLPVEKAVRMLAAGFTPDRLARAVWTYQQGSA